MTASMTDPKTKTTSWGAEQSPDILEALKELGKMNGVIATREIGDTGVVIDIDLLPADTNLRRGVLYHDNLLQNDLSIIFLPWAARWVGDTFVKVRKVPDRYLSRSHYRIQIFLEPHTYEEKGAVIGFSFPEPEINKQSLEEQV
jgi:hypothetical protein